MCADVSPNFVVPSDEADCEKRRSRFRGVAWDSKHECWRVKIFYRGKQRHVGRYCEEDEAAKAYDAAAVYLYGGYATTNFGLAAALSSGTKVSNPIVKARLLTDLAEQQGRRNRYMTGRATGDLPGSQHQQPLTDSGDTASGAAGTSATAANNTSAVPSFVQVDCNADRPQPAAAFTSTLTDVVPAGTCAKAALSGPAINAGGPSVMASPSNTLGPVAQSPIRPRSQQHPTTLAVAPNNIIGLETPPQHLSPQTVHQTPVAQQTVVPVVMLSADQANSLSQLVVSSATYPSSLTQQPTVLTQQLHQQPIGQQQPLAIVYQPDLQQQQQQVMLMATPAPQMATVLQQTGDQLNSASDVVLVPDQQAAANMHYAQLPVVSAQEPPGDFLLEASPVQNTTGLFMKPEAPITVVVQPGSSSRMVSSQSSTILQGSGFTSRASQPPLITLNQAVDYVYAQAPGNTQAIPQQQHVAFVTDQNGTQYQLVYQPAAVLPDPPGLNMSSPLSLPQTAQGAQLIDTAAYRVWGGTTTHASYPI